MKIVPINIEFRVLYENRHLYTDDSQYNSLVVSNLFNSNINLISIEDYDVLEYEHKKQIHCEAITSYKYILSKNGVYLQTDHPYNLIIYSWQRHWQEIQSQSFFINLFNNGNKILTIVD